MSRESLIKDIGLDIQESIKQIEPILAKTCQAYTQLLPQIFAAPSERFQETDCLVTPDIKNISFAGRFDRTIGSSARQFN